MEAQRAGGRGYNEPRTTLKKGRSPFFVTPANHSVALPDNSAFPSDSRIAPPIDFIIPPDNLVHSRAGFVIPSSGIVTPRLRHPERRRSPKQSRYRPLKC